MVLKAKKAQLNTLKEKEKGENLDKIKVFAFYMVVFDET